LAAAIDRTRRVAAACRENLASGSDSSIAGAFAGHPQATEAEATRAQLMVELVVSKSIIRGMRRGDVYRRQIEWCQD
jgi:hypothetical protein